MSATTVLNQVLKVLRLAYGYLAPLEALTNAVHVPTNVRVALGASGPVILAVEHFVQALQDPTKSINHTTTYVSGATK